MELFIDHLEEDVTHDGETRRIAREMWIQHREALQLLIELRPKLEDIRDRFLTKMKAGAPDVEVAFYPPARGDLKEIKIKLKSWNQLGCQFTLMLRLEEGSLRAGLLLWSQSYEENPTLYDQIAVRVNSEKKLTFDSNYPKIPGWEYWRRVLVSGEEVLKAQTFDDASVEEAAGVLLHYRTILNPIITGLRGQGQSAN